jgi:hypothetical protein
MIICRGRVSLAPGGYMPAYQLSGGRLEEEELRIRNGELGMRFRSYRSTKLQPEGTLNIQGCGDAVSHAKPRSNKAVIRNKICMDTQDIQYLTFKIRACLAQIYAESWIFNIQNLEFNIPASPG